MKKEYIVEQWRSSPKHSYSYRAREKKNRKKNFEQKFQPKIFYDMGDAVTINRIVP